MARYRIGNDMTILWSITNKDGNPFPLAGKEVHLYYTCERGRYEAEIEIQGNVVSWEFLASRQKALGGYTLTLEVLQSNGKRALKRDLCDAFVLVGKNCEEKFDHDGAHIEEGGIVNLVTSLEVYRISPIIPYVVRDENGIGYWYVDGENTGDRSTGITAYEYAKSKGYKGTEGQFAEKLAEFPDWNVADSSVGGYIKGRTHGVTYERASVEGTLEQLGYIPEEYVSVLHYAGVQGGLEGKGLYLGGLLYNPIVGEEYSVKYDGPSVYARVVEVEDGYDVQIKGTNDTGNVLKVAIVDYKRIDDAYIPDTILRVEDIDSALSTESENPVQNKVITEEMNKNPFEKGSGENSVVLKGGDNQASAQFATSLGYNTIASGQASHAEGGEYNNIQTQSRGQASHAEGAGTIANADGTHSEGILTTAGRDSNQDALQDAVILGITGTNEELVLKLRGYGAHSEGMSTKALGTGSHAEGSATQALSNSSHAEGDTTIAWGEASHAEGYNTKSEGNQSHAGGKYTTTHGNSSFAHGDNLITNNIGEGAFGRYNVSNRGDNANTRTVYSIGIGSETIGRKNAYEIMKDGKHYVYGIGGYDGKSTANAKDLAQVITKLEERTITVDSSLSLESENPVQNKVITEELGKKADTDGVYSKMTVGRSVDLLGVEDVEEGSFVFRPTDGDGSIKDGVAAVKSVKGDSVVWNQLIQPFTFWNLSQGGEVLNGGKGAKWSASNRTGALNAYSNFFDQYASHKYLISANVKASSNKVGLGIYYSFSQHVAHSGSGNWERLSVIINSFDGKEYCYVTDSSTSDFSDIEVADFICIDLTKMFQAGNEPTTIEEYEARKPIVADEYAFNEGEVVNMKATRIKSVGFNAWDEEWRQGFFVAGDFHESPTQIASANPFKVLPNQEYYINQDTLFYWWFYDENMQYVGHTYTFGGVFKVPENAKYMHFNAEPDYGPTYNHDICINLVHSGYRNGEYEPYVEDVLDLPTLDLFPNGMNKIDEVYDEYDEEKSVQRIGSVDLGTLDWDTGNDSIFIAILNDMNPTLNTTTGVIAKYSPCTSANGSSMISGDDKTYVTNGSWVGGAGRFTIKDTAYTDTASFKAAMTGVILYYELAEPIVTPHKQRLVYKAWDFGTEQIIADGNTTAITAGITYEFNARDTIRGNKAKNEVQDERLRSLESVVVRKGDYSPENKVGLADDLAGRGESALAEFTFRASGGKSIKDGSATIKELQGNAVVYNQGLNYQPWTYSSSEGIYENGVYTLTPTGEYPGIASFFPIEVSPRVGDKYVALCDFYYEGGTQGYIGFNLGGNQISYWGLPQGKWNAVALFGIADREDPYDACIVFGPDDATLIKFKNMRYHNLTKMYQAGNEPTTIEEYYARKPIVADEYAYNEGEVIAFNGDAIKSVGDNAWDEEVELGSIDANNGALQNNSTRLRSKNYIRVLPNQEYYFLGSYGYGIAMFDENKVSQGALYVNNGTKTIPSNVHYIKFNFPADYGTTYKHDYMITLVHSGWKVDTNAGYQPYWADTLPIDSRIKAEFPNGMHKWDKVYNKDGKGYIVKGMGVADLGDLHWYNGQGGNGQVLMTSPSLQEVVAYSQDVNLICGAICKAYVARSAVDTYNGIEGISINNLGEIKLYDSRYTDAESFKAAMAGTMLYYELAEPEILEFDTPFKLDYKVADFGTEELLSEQPSAPFKARTIYQFNAVDQIRENYNEIEKIKAALAKAGITIDL